MSNNAKTPSSFPAKDWNHKDEDFLTLQLIRLFAFSLITVFLKNIVGLSPNLLWLLLAVILGGYFSGHLLKKGHRFGVVLGWHTLVFVVAIFGLRLANFILLSYTASDPGYDFLIYKISDTVLLVLLFYLLSFLETWFFWTNKHAITWEGVGAGAFLVWLLKAHRNYQIDAPKELSSLSWELQLFQGLQLQPQHLFIAIGLLFVLLAVPYLVMAETRQLYGSRPVVITRGPLSWAASGITILLFLAALVYYGVFLNKRYSADLSRVSSGVGMGEAPAEGESNLGFHSAISPTKQPAALVRLENDYDLNPHAPMLYFREGALSSYNGRELVTAPLNFDKDVPKIAPGRTYISSEKPNSESRTPLIQSIYFLTKHSNSFAVDYPITVRLLKNPSPERFLLAYQVESLAPSKNSYYELGKAPLGNSSWSKEQWNHYLKAPGSSQKKRADRSSSKKQRADIGFARRRCKIFSTR